MNAAVDRMLRAVPAVLRPLLPEVCAALGECLLELTDALLTDLEFFDGRGALGPTSRWVARDGGTVKHVPIEHLDAGLDDPDDLEQREMRQRHHARPVVVIRRYNYRAAEQFDVPAGWERPSRHVVIGQRQLDLGALVLRL